MSTSPGYFDDFPQALARRCYVLWLLLATACGMRTSLERSEPRALVSSGGATSSGGASGRGDPSNGTGTRGTAGSGGDNSSAGMAGTAGVTGNGGLTGPVGGGLGSGIGGDGSGGVADGGGTTAAGGASSTGGSMEASVFGMPCTNNQDCPPDATCCDGSDERCDGTNLPPGVVASPGEFVVDTDGLTVADALTGLLWERDGSGTRNGCSGGAGGVESGNLTCTWAEAQAYCASLTLGGLSGWRLPAPMELFTIVDFMGTNVTIDSVAFPNTPAEVYWTSLRYAGSLPDAWIISFSTGMSGFADVRAYHNRVRCVRGSRCYPADRFAVYSAGLVDDTLTGLVWQQEASTTTMSFTDAQTYCSSAGSGFRLPTLKELFSIVDHTVTSGPQIDQTAFPNTPAEGFFWVSPPCAGSSCPEWGIDFSSSSGSTFFNPGITSSLRTRCVHGR